MAGTEVATTDPAVPKPVVTREFMLAFQALGEEVRGALADLGEFERQTFVRATVLARHRADDIAARREALATTLVEAEKAMQKEFDRYAIRREAAARGGG